MTYWFLQTSLPTYLLSSLLSGPFSLFLFYLFTIWPAFLSSSFHSPYVFGLISIFIEFYYSHSPYFLLRFSVLLSTFTVLFYYFSRPALLSRIFFCTSQCFFLSLLHCPVSSSIFSSDSLFFWYSLIFRFSYDLEDISERNGRRRQT